MHRRTILGTGCQAAALSVAGCLQALDTGGEASPRDAEDALYPDERTVPADAGTHDLYVENYDDVVHAVDLRVVRRSDDALVWRAAYDAPDRRGFSIPDLLVEGRTYEVRLDVVDGPSASDTLSIEACSGAEGGKSRNLGVWIEDGTITFRQDGCDEIIVGAKLNYGDHRSFIVDDSA